MFVDDIGGGAGEADKSAAEMLRKRLAVFEEDPDGGVGHLVWINQQTAVLFWVFQIFGGEC